MSGKFSTTNSQLFNNTNSEQIPDWMTDLCTEKIKERDTLDLGIEAKGVFAEKQTVYRDNIVGTPRYLEAGFNDTKLTTDAKIQLAKFLAGKYYEAEPKVLGNTVIMNVNIGNIPGVFKFAYKVEAGKLLNEPTFVVSTDSGDAEYPFSRAGFEECVMDVKLNKPKVAKKVISGTPSMITLEEIVRRFNGSHREAMDTTRKLVESGDIIGVGSNTYASMYSIDDLFPKMEKEAADGRLPEFHFAPNIEHVAANPYTSAKILAIDASKTLAEFFHDFIIQCSSRDNEELLVKAKVMTDNGTHEDADFCFGIDNDKVASIKFVEFRDERMTIDQILQKMNKHSNILDAYLKQNPTTAKRIYRGIVLTSKEIHRRLAKIADKKIVTSIINNWVERDLITPVNSTTFTTTSSFEDLLAAVNTKLLSTDEIADITDQQRSFGAGIDFNRQDVQDTGVRNDYEIESSDEIRLANLYNELSKTFQDFQLEITDSGPVLTFVTAGGTQPVCKLAVDYNGNEVKSITAIRGGYAAMPEERTSLEKFAEALNYSPVLKAYLQMNPGKKFVAASIISMPKLRKMLADIVAPDEIDFAIKHMLAEKNIQSIGSNNYVSKYPIAKLLNMTPVKVLSAEDMAEIQTAKAHFGRALEREAVIDTGTRDMDITPTEEQLLNTANNYLAKHFSNFQCKGFTVAGDKLNYIVNIFDSASGLRTDINFMFEMDKMKVAKCGVVIGNDIVSIANVKHAFAQNDVLKKYLEVHAGNRVDAPMIMTVEKLVKKLSSVTGANVQEIEDTVAHWHKLGKISKIGTNAFASRFTIEQLLSMSNLKPLSDIEFEERIAKSQREKLMKVSAAHIKDNDTRNLSDEWSANKLMIFAKAELNKLFKQYEVLDAKLNVDKFEVTASVTNNGLRNKKIVAWKMENGKPSGSIIIDTTSANYSEELETFIKLNKPDNTINKGLISKSQLKNKLSTIIDMSMTDEIMDTLIEAEMITPINSNVFASKYSISEIAERLTAFNKTNIETAREQRKLAIRDEGMVQLSSATVIDTGSRIIEQQDKSLSPKMLKLKEKISININNGLTSKLITAKKHTQLKMDLDAAKTEHDLENIWREFKKYLC